MDGEKTVGLLALERIGNALRAQYGIKARLPYELSDLVQQLKRLTRKNDYLDNAAELVRLARQAGSDKERAHLIKLAEDWIELAEKAHEEARRPRPHIILHPLVEEKLGKLRD